MKAPVAANAPWAREICPAMPVMTVIDRKIVALLQEDASLSLAQIAHRAGLSQSPCWKRIQRLEKAGVILADPPWAFKAYSNKGITTRSAESHYSTEEVRSLAKIPVADMASHNSAMFMWVVDSHLDQGIELMKQWGFKFKTIAFVWVKTGKNGQPRMSMGLWTRKMSEICLLGTRGKPKRLSGGVRQVIMAPRREHSRKPDEIYERIEALVAGPYLEMFARQRREGWASWGNEVDKFAPSVKFPEPGSEEWEDKKQREHDLSVAGGAQ